MRIGITGATGHLGRLIIEDLKQKDSDLELVALVRSPEKAEDLKLEVRYFDYSKPETLVHPLQGLDTLMLVSASEIGKRAQQHKNVIDAAKIAGIKWIVYTSLLHADTTPIKMGAEHMTAENLLKGSGIDYTILRNGWYTENYYPGIQGALTQGTLVGCAADGRISSAARADYADAAATVLTSAGHQNKTYELAGDYSFTLQEMAAEISKQTGRNIPYANLSKTEYANTLKRAGVPESFAGFVAEWDTDTSHGALYAEGSTLSKLIGHPTVTMADSIQSFLKSKQGV